MNAIRDGVLFLVPDALRVTSGTTRESDRFIFLQIADNGMGLDLEKIDMSKGIGWKNIFARVNLLNGSLDVRSEGKSGTRIEIALPLYGSK